MKRSFLVACFSFIFFVINNSSFANQVFEGEFSAWQVLSVDNANKQKICYIASNPTKKSGNYTKREEPYILVTKFPDNSIEVSVSVGYTYKIGSDVKIVADSNRAWALFSKDELAWAKDSKQDADIIESMKKDSLLVVNATSTKGTYSIDEYSLKGFTNAYNKMLDICKK